MFLVQQFCLSRWWLRPEHSSKRLNDPTVSNLFSSLSQMFSSTKLGGPFSPSLPFHGRPSIAIAGNDYRVRDLHASGWRKVLLKARCFSTFIRLIAIHRRNKWRYFGERPCRPIWSSVIFEDCSTGSLSTLATGRRIRKGRVSIVDPNILVSFCLLLYLTVEAYLLKVC